MKGHTVLTGLLAAIPWWLCLCRHSPHLLEVKVLQTPNRKNYRRAKLYFLRDRQPKEYRVA